MEKLNKIEGKYYTQNADLPISERVFFREGIVVNKSDFRVATDEEVDAWREYQRKQEEEQRAMMGGTDNEQPM